MAKRLGARSVIAAGRNRQALEELKGLGADATLALDQESSLLAAEICEVCSRDGVDIVLDYLWGRPAESLLEALSQKGLQRSTPRIRFIQVGSMAGATITLPAATLRSTGIELIGSGFGSAKIEQIFQAVAEFFKEAARLPFHIEVQEAPLKDIEALWDKPDLRARLVFRP
jgi:NADPH2:quinone reductase